MAEELTSYDANKLDETIYGRIEAPDDSMRVAARFSRVDESGTPWVVFEGAETETPLTSPIPMETNPGDLIEVTVSGYEAYAYGNYDNPSTGLATTERIRQSLDVVANTVQAHEGRFGYLEADTAYIRDLKADSITTDDIKSATGYIADLKSDNIEADTIAANVGKIKDLTGESLSYATGYIADLKSKNITAEDISADHATIDSLDSNYAHITNGVIDNAKIGYADVNGLNANYAHVANGVIDNAKIGYADVNALDAHYAEIDLANVNNAWVQNGVIKDAAITDAQIIGVSANKLTAGTIDAAKINVANLRAKNLIVEKLNGQPVLGGYELVSQNSSGYASKNPSQEGWYEYSNGAWSASTDTAVDMSKAYYKDGGDVALYDQAYIDGMERTLNQRIDGAVETFTGAAVPSLVNYPAADWSASEYDSHVGDIYYVVNAGGQADGYSYRFTKTGTGSSATYGWTLIRDSDITKALQDILDINGALDIDSIIASDYTVYSFMTHTDGELSNLQTAQSTLETALGTKVDTTTFNEVKQAVDENSATITSMSETVQHGGKNLLPHTGVTAADKEWLKDNISSAWNNLAIETVDGESAYKYDPTWGPSYWHSGSWCTLKADTYYTYSVDLHYTKDVPFNMNSLGHFQVYNAASEKSDKSHEDVSDKRVFTPATIPANTWTRASVTFLTNGLDGSTFQIYPRFNIAANDGTLHFKNAKLELGTIATPWDHASEDVTTLTNTVNSVKQTATSNSAAISSLSSTVTANKTSIENRASEIEQNLNGFKTTVSRTLAESARNMLDGTVSQEISNLTWSVANQRANPHKLLPYQAAQGPITRTEHGVRIDYSGTGSTPGIVYPLIEDGCIAAGEQLNLSLTYRGNITSLKAIYFLNARTPNTSQSGFDAPLLSDGEWHTLSITWTAALGATEPVAFLIGYATQSSGKWLEVRDGSAILERGDISSRVSTAETAIEQTADAIGLSASGTTTTTTIANPNLSPYFEYLPLVNKSAGSPYWYYLNGFTAMEDGWAKGVMDNSSGSSTTYINMREQAIDALKPSTVYTAMLEVRNYSGSGTTSWVVPHRTTSGQISSFAAAKSVAINKNGVYRLEITTLSDLSNVNEGCSAYIQVNAGAKISLECRMSLYEGTYRGSWKPYSGSQLYTSRSEFKVTTDGISSTVSKIGAMKYFDTTYSYSNANIETYSAEGYTGGWNVTTSTDGTRIGDVVYLKVYDSDRKCYVYIKGTVTAVNSINRLTVKSHGYEDTLPVATIKSTINQSADSVKIKASHVDIEGAAIFKGSGRLSEDSLNATFVGEKEITTATDFNTLTSSGVYYIKNGSCANAPVTNWGKLDVSVSGKVVQLFYPDALSYYYYRAQTSGTWSAWTKVDGVGAAADVQANLDKLGVSGRNLLVGTYSPRTSAAITLNSSNYQIWDTYELYAPYNKIVKTGDLITVSFDWSCTATGGNWHLECGFGSPYSWGTVVKATGTRNATSNYVDVSSSNKSGHVEVTFRAEAAHVSAVDTLRWLRIRVDGTQWSGQTFHIANAKAERGNRASEWTYAPEDTVEIGRNLAMHPDIPAQWTLYAPTSYQIAKIPLSEDFKTGYTYTVTIWGGPITRSDKSDCWYSCYWGGGNFALGNAKLVSTGVYRCTFTVSPTSTEQHTAVPQSLVLYNTPPVGASGTTYSSPITRVKVERAAQATDFSYTPESVVVRTQRIYYRSNSTTAPTAPTAWVTSTATANSTWSTKRMQYDSTYKYLYTCVQSQNAAGGISCTAVLLDDTTTVIDGGNIITGTVTANQVNFADASGSKLKLFDPSASTNYVTIDSDGMDVRKGGTSVASFGESARVGKAAGPRTVIQASGVDLYGASDGSVTLAHFGYASGNAESGTSVQPYYTLGTRKSGSAVGNWSVAEGNNVEASGFSSHTEGRNTAASGHYSHAEGLDSAAGGSCSHAEGGAAKATEDYSHAEGWLTTASGIGSHAEGLFNIASGDMSHVEGGGSNTSTTLATYGPKNEASGKCSHAEGRGTVASADSSHVEGRDSTASGDYSHAQNQGTIAASTAQTAIGKYNAKDTSGTYALIIGGGSSDSARKDIFNVEWDGDTVQRGSIYYQGTKSKGRMIRFMDNPSGTDGNGVAIGAGGLAVLGAGESADNLITALSLAANTEDAYVSADGKVCIVPNCNTIANRKVFTFTTGGNLEAPGLFQGTNAHNAITAVSNGAVTLSTSYQNVTLASNVNIGSGFSIVSGGVKCAVVGTVEVSSQAYFTGLTAQDQVNLSVVKGSTQVAHSTSGSAKNAVQMMTMPKLITVAAGDILYLQVSNATAARGSVPNYNTMTYMTVKYV